MFLIIMGPKGRFLAMMVDCVDMLTCSCMDGLVVEGTLLTPQQAQTHIAS